MGLVIGLVRGPGCLIIAHRGADYSMDYLYLEEEEAMDDYAAAERVNYL